MISRSSLLRGLRHLLEPGGRRNHAHDARAILVSYCGLPDGEITWTSASTNHSFHVAWASSLTGPRFMSWQHLNHWPFTNAAERSSGRIPVVQMQPPLKIFHSPPHIRGTKPAQSTGVYDAAIASTTLRRRGRSTQLASPPAFAQGTSCSLGNRPSSTMRRHTSSIPLMTTPGWSLASRGPCARFARSAR